MFSPVIFFMTKHIIEQASIMFRLNNNILLLPVILFSFALSETKHDRIPAITTMLLAGILLYYICFGSLCSPQHIWIPAIKAIFFDKSKNKEI